MDSSVGRSIIGKSVQQCLDLFELIVTAHIMFSSERVVTNKAAEIYEINSTASTDAHIATLIKQVELHVKLQIHGANLMMVNLSCENCERNYAKNIA